MSSNTSHCIEWHKVKDIFDIRGGYTPSKSNKEYWSDGQIPWFVMEDIRESGRKLYEAKQKVAECAVKRGALFPIDSILLATSATVGEHAILKTEGIANQRFANLALKDSFKSKLRSDFLFYYMFIVDEWCKKNTNISGFASVDMSKLKELLLPIPPLDEQERIVSILDKYSDLENKLINQIDREIELTLKQYEYYRDDLLSFKDSDTKWIAMGDIGEFIRGNGLQKKDFVESGVGCIHYGEIYTYYGTSATKTKSFVSEELALKLKKAKHGDLILTTTSENTDDVCTAVAWLGEDDICIGGHSCLFRHNQNPKFLAYLTQTSLFSSYKRRYGQGVKVVEMSCKKLETFELPIPSLEEQERIVAILDKYSESVDKLVSNLRREKELVQKQYEYYREKLLTF